MFLVVFMRLKSSGRSNLEKSMQVLLASLSWFRVISRIPILLLKMASWKSSTRSEIMWSGGAGGSGLGTLGLGVLPRASVRSWV